MTRKITEERRRVDARLRRAAFRLEASKIEHAWAIVSAHRAGHSVRDIASVVGLSPARIHQILHGPEADVAEPRLDALREAGWPAPEDCDDGGAAHEQLAARLADEADLLRQCAEWLRALKQAQNEGSCDERQTKYRPSLRDRTSYGTITSATGSSWSGGRDEIPLSPGVGTSGDDAGVLTAWLTPNTPSQVPNP